MASPQDEASPKIIKVSSVGQIDGVTAGVVHGGIHIQAPPVAKVAKPVPWYTRLTTSVRGLTILVVAIGALGAATWAALDLWSGHGTTTSPRGQELLMPNGDSFHVTSNNQQGGITAGQINNYGKPPRHADEAVMNQLCGMIPDKSKKIRVACVMGDAEAFAFGTELNTQLRARGYSVWDSAVIGVSAAPWNNVRVVPSADPILIEVGSQP